MWETMKFYLMNGSNAWIRLWFYLKKDKKIGRSNFR